MDKLYDKIDARVTNNINMPDMLLPALFGVVGKGGYEDTGQFQNTFVHLYNSYFSYLQ